VQNADPPALSTSSQMGGGPNNAALFLPHIHKMLAAPIQKSDLLKLRLSNGKTGLVIVYQQFTGRSV
jgi:hypothetical protein